MNRFTSDEPTSVPVLRIDPELERQQIERLERVRSRRDKAEVIEALAQIEAAARTDQNLMPHIVRAVESYATLGEISDRLRAVFGEYTGETYE
jgi:methylmalonyl-CoA mutase N-terminal domain/subunit